MVKSKGPGRASEVSYQWDLHVKLEEACLCGGIWHDRGRRSRQWLPSSQRMSLSKSGEQRHPAASTKVLIAIYKLDNASQLYAFCQLPAGELCCLRERVLCALSKLKQLKTQPQSKCDWARNIHSPSWQSTKQCVCDDESMNCLASNGIKITTSKIKTKIINQQTICWNFTYFQEMFATQNIERAGRARLGPAVVICKKKTHRPRGRRKIDIEIFFFVENLMKF